MTDGRPVPGCGGGGGFYSRCCWGQSADENDVMRLIRLPAAYRRAVKALSNNTLGG